jgi:hypothetical protein
MMNRNQILESYAPRLLIYGTAAASLSTCFIIFVYFVLITGNYHGPDPSNSDFVVATLWCTASYTLAGLATTIVPGRLRGYLPSWLVVGVAGSALFVYSISLITYFNEISTYRPDNPFRRPPPELREVILSALLLTLLLSFFAILSAAASFALKQSSDREPEFHIDPPSSDNYD